MRMVMGFIDYALDNIFCPVWGGGRPRKQGVVEDFDIFKKKLVKILTL